MADVDSLIENAKGYAESTVETASRAMDMTTALVNAVGYMTIEAPEITVDDDLRLPNLPNVPSIDSAEFVLPPEPGAPPTYQDVGSIDTSGAPTLRASMPSLSMPSKPSELPGFHEQVPTINTDIAFPEPPDQLVNPTFTDPVIVDRAAPEKPTVALPDFNAVVPVNTALAPTDLDQKMEQSYRGIHPTMVALLEDHVDQFIAKMNPEYHSQMARIETQLQRYLDGGTALNPTVENAIYERNRDKLTAEYKRVRDTAWNDAAARGFTLPTGAVHTTIMSARQAASDNLARASTEIAINQAEMEQKNLQFAVTTSTGLRTTILNAAINYHSNLVQINGQALEYAKTVVGLLVESYNVAVKAYSVALDGYRAEVQAYEVKLRGALAGIELYKAEIDALQAMVQVDVARVSVYRARIDSLKSLADVYRSRIDAIATKANMEKLKLELFGSQVQAYTALVQAKNSEWQGYRSALDGEQMKVGLFTAQVQAYGVETTGWKAKIEGQAEAVRAAAATNQARATQYESAVRAYAAVVSARGDVARTKLENERQQLVAFQAETQAAVSYANLAASYYKTRADVAVSYADIQLKSKVAQADSMRNWQTSVTQLAIASSNQYVGLAQTAMSGMNSLVVAEQQ